jgi:hypothetical protein
MPGATHRSIDYETIGKRTMIMGAMWGDGEDFVSHSHQENVLTINMTDKRPSFGDVIETYASDKVRTGQLRFVFRHRRLRRP